MLPAITLARISLVVLMVLVVVGFLAKYTRLYGEHAMPTNRKPESTFIKTETRDICAAAQESRNATLTIKAKTLAMAMAMAMAMPKSNEADAAKDIIPS